MMGVPVPGTAGNDEFKGTGVAEDFQGGGGTDGVSYEFSTEGVKVSLLEGQGEGGFAEGDTYDSIENLLGSDHDDQLLGDNNANKIDGGKGNDIIKGAGGADKLAGRAGDDTLVGDGGKDKLNGGKGEDFLNGGLGNDVLKGGKQADSFAFSTELKNNNVDTIKDFKVNTDMVLLDTDIFSSVGVKLGNGEFRVGAKAKDGNDYIMYNDNNGRLFYDADGKGGVDKIQFAQLDAGLNLDAGDFKVYDALI